MATEKFSSRPKSPEFIGFFALKIVGGLSIIANLLEMFVAQFFCLGSGRKEQLLYK